MKKTFKITMAALLATATMAVGMGGMSASAASVNKNEIRNEQNDILVWQETDSNAISLYAYNQWTSAGSKYVYGYDGSTIIGRQYLTSYIYMKILMTSKKLKQLLRITNTIQVPRNTLMVGVMTQTAILERVLKQ